MIEVDAAQGPSPLGMPPAEFLRDYWQKQPLLIRNAFPGFVSPVEPEDLAGLACEDGVLARLIEHDKANDAWRVRHGPFAEADFPGLPDHDWTLLVQDVDKWDADIRALLPRFDFLPRWRIDDVMVSFAATGGSVGAHVDQYDVFLLQAQGQRRWQIDASPAPALEFRNDVDIKLLREFHPTHDWVLGPGDMLYLPPGVPHHGVAENACLTFSVGMRAPASAELLGDYVDTLAADAPDDHPPTRAEMERALAGGAALLRHPWSRMAWRRLHAGDGAHLYAGGGAHPLPVEDARRLAAAEAIDGALYAALESAGRDAVFALLAAGHYHLEREDDA
jgi:50S ribosomal protein L16 3-hydroxylase